MVVNNFFSLSVVLISTLLLRDPSCQEKSSGKSSLLPLSVGNTWIYRDSVVEDGKLVSVSNDTLRIEKKSSFENSDTYLFSDGKEIMQRGDTLFQIVSQRGGYKFPTMIFYPSETASSFNYAFGGDVVMQRTVSRLPACRKNDFNISRCYKVSDSCGGEISFGVGVGVYREKATDCSSPSKNYTIKTLIAVNFQK
jgi:hypothetical protein